MQESYKAAGLGQQLPSGFDWRAWLAAGMGSMASRAGADGDVHPAATGAGTSGSAAVSQAVFGNGER